MLSYNNKKELVKYYHENGEDEGQSVSYGMQKYKKEIGNIKNPEATLRNIIHGQGGIDNINAKSEVWLAIAQSRLSEQWQAKEDSYEQQIKQLQLQIADKDRMLAAKDARIERLETQESASQAARIQLHDKLMEKERELHEAREGEAILRHEHQLPVMPTRRELAAATA